MKTYAMAVQGQGSRVPQVEPTDPLYVHPSDNPAQPLVSNPGNLSTGDASRSGGTKSNQNNKGNRNNRNKGGRGRNNRNNKVASTSITMPQSTTSQSVPTGAVLCDLVVSSYGTICTPPVPLYCRTNQSEGILGSHPNVVYQIYHAPDYTLSEPLILLNLNQCS